MKTGRILGIALVGLLLASATAGCHYHREEIEPFLLKPRRPLTGTDYPVLPPDAIQITSLHVPEIGGTFTIGPDGKINFPLLGEIYVAELTPKEIEQKLMAAAKDYYEQVDANVRVTGYNSRKFYVFGPSGGGPRQWTGRDSLLDALVGMTGNRGAWQERVIVLRVSEPTKGGYITAEPSWKYRVLGIHRDRPDKPRFKMLINLKAMWQHGDMANNILLKPDDIVYVRPTPWTWIGMKIRDILQPVSPVLEAVRVRYTLTEGLEESIQGRDDDDNNND